MPRQSRLVEVVWKIAKPRRRQTVELLLASHWQTATSGSTEPVQSLLIRSDLHDTTSDNRGRRVRDDWHVTTSWKTAWLKIRNMFRTGHGYTKGRDNYQVQHVTVSGDIPLDARKSKGKYIWPVEPLDTRKYEREMIEEDYLNYLVDRMG